MEIKIIIHDMKNRYITLLVNKNDTIGSAKEKYCSKVGLENGIKWKYDRFILKDSDTCPCLLSIRIVVRILINALD